jgi:hypothetical protein
VAERPAGEEKIEEEKERRGKELTRGANSPEGEERKGAWDGRAEGKNWAGIVAHAGRKERGEWAGPRLLGHCPLLLFFFFSFSFLDPSYSNNSI